MIICQFVVAVLYAIGIVGMQMRSTEPDPSRMRLELQRLAQEILDLVAVFATDQPMVKGSAYRLRRKCGKPTCACVRGKLHASWVLSSSEGGKTRLRMIRPGTRIELRQQTGRYRRFRKARARLIAIHNQMLDLVDRMALILRREI